MSIDLGKIVSSLGANTIAEIGEPLGLSKKLLLKAARSLTQNCRGNIDEAIAGASKETGVGKDALYGRCCPSCWRTPGRRRLIM
ncbi:MAG: hypothetical protein ABL956_09535 [Hyphomonadaceae bacterium]